MYIIYHVSDDDCMCEQNVRTRNTLEAVILIREDIACPATDAGF